MENKIKQVVVYDLAQLPKGKTIENIIEDFNKEGLIIWDSSTSINKSAPYVYTLHT